MTVREIAGFLNKKYPEKAAEDFDNPGLIFGSGLWDVSSVLVALDATDDVVLHAVNIGADLIVTHHPMIFSSIKKINDDTFLGKKLLCLGENKIAVYATHTNYDAYRMGELCNGVLGLSDPEVLEPTDEVSSDSIGIGTIGSLPGELTLSELAERVKEKFNIEAVRFFGEPDKKVKKVALLPGSGRSFIKTAIKKGADVMITGDIDHHTGIDALQDGLPIIDAGHYGIEHVFIKDVSDLLRKEFPMLSVTAEEIKTPFTTI
ncbi:MAG: Nif3-like dinuclear metal center hexameric protein [Lachnospiraceae bacterium]|nr:Nif3-like dinuclear metal center hexameric protein [Lachnospiraceae bacterium]